MMRSAITLLVAAAILLVAAAVFIALGLYNVAATEQHTRPVYALIEATMRQAIRFHARDIVAPPLDDAARVHSGRSLYARNCVRCHGAPGIAPESFALGMTPFGRESRVCRARVACSTTLLDAEARPQNDGHAGVGISTERWSDLGYRCLSQAMPAESPQAYRAATRTPSVKRIRPF
jgi:Cytochrome c